MPMPIKEPIFSPLPHRPTAHCATLAELPDGSLLAGWFGGSYETAPDVAILTARRDPQRGGWSPPEVAVEVPGQTLGQPVFLVHPNGELWLFFDLAPSFQAAAVSPPAPNRHLLPPIAYWDWTRAQPFRQRSLDYGRTWQAPEPLLDYPGLMFRSRPLLLPGRIILPVYDENTWESRMLISDDEGRSWRLTAPLRTPGGNIHPCVVRLPGHRLLAYLRTGGAGGVIWRSASADGGETWSQPTPTSFPNPNSGLDLLRLENGALVLAFNNSDRRRTPLCLALAEAGESWQWQRTLEDDADEGAEFSYPTLLQSRDGLIHVVYTYRREHIHYACFTEKWLRKDRINREL